MNLGEKIKSLRKEKDWNMQTLSERLGVSIGIISEWERNTNEPNPKNRKKLCEVFSITEAELFGAPPPLKEPSAPYLNPEILEALQDPVAVKGLLIIHKNSQEIKDAIKALLETIPNLSAEKRQAILALCR